MIHCNANIVDELEYVFLYYRVYVNLVPLKLIYKLYRRHKVFSMDELQHHIETKHGIRVVKLKKSHAQTRSLMESCAWFITDNHYVYLGVTSPN